MLAFHARGCSRLFSPVCAFYDFFPPPSMRLLIAPQDEKGLYTSPTLLAGSIDTGTTMLLTGNMEPVAEKKFQVCPYVCRMRVRVCCLVCA